MATWNPLAVRSEFAGLQEFRSCLPDSNIDKNMDIGVNILVCFVLLAASVKSSSVVRRSSTECVCF